MNIEEKLAFCKIHYEKVVSNYLKRHEFNAVIDCDDFLTGYSLFALGKSMGFTTALKELTNFLQMANVVLKTDLEQDNYSKAIADIQMSLEEISQPRM